MATDQRRAAARRRAWGRGPMILRFEPLEGRELLSASSTALPDLTGQSFQVQSSSNLGWGDTVQVQGVVINSGTAPTTSSFQVELYASPSAGLNQGATGLGSVTIPAGLQPGATAPVTDTVTLPVTPLTGLGTPASVYVGMAIDPNDQIAESNKVNNYDVGLGKDLALVNVTGHPAASLVGTGIQVTPSQTSWGGTLNVTESITNNGNADAPATTALVLLTPSTAAVGGLSDATVGTINVPALAAGQTTTINQTINLPSTAPTNIAGGSAFTLSIAQDANYVTNQVYPHTASQGAGLDSASVKIDTPSYAAPASTSLPNLTVTSVSVPGSNIPWGQNFQVSATLANAGTVDSGSFRIRFVLTGTDGTTHGIFLGDVGMSNLAAGATQTINQTLKLPATLPNGVALNSQSIGTIAVILDPEHTFNETSNASTIGFSNTVTLGAPPVATTPPASTATPTTTATTTTTTTTTTAKTTHAEKVAQLAEARAAARAAAVAKAATKPKAKPAKHTLSHNLDVFPKNASDFLKKLVKKL